MSDPLLHGLLTDPPALGCAKLRIRSDGTAEGTFVVVVDHEGIERRLAGVQRLEWSISNGDRIALAKVEIVAPEVDLDVPPQEELPWLAQICRRAAEAGGDDLEADLDQPAEGP